jgi:hypothetical protein
VGRPSHTSTSASRRTCRGARASSRPEDRCTRRRPPRSPRSRGACRTTRSSTRARSARRRDARAEGHAGASCKSAASTRRQPRTARLVAATTRASTADGAFATTACRRQGHEHSPRPRSPASRARARVPRGLAADNTGATSTRTATLRDGAAEPAKASSSRSASELQRAGLAGIRAEPRVNGSILRINRDTRFSTDKRPYKDHLDFWFWEGERRAASGPDCRAPDGRRPSRSAPACTASTAALAAYRAAVADEPRPRARGCDHGDRLAASRRRPAYKRVRAGSGRPSARGPAAPRRAVRERGLEALRARDGPAFVGWAPSASSAWRR